MFELIARIVSFFYDLTDSYALSILMLTMLMMILVAPLTFKSTKSMIEMRRIQPLIKKVQTKYADDRELMNAELMKLYQKHGVNPVGGCLPMLVQAPIFFVLFRVVRGLTRRLSDIGYVAGDTLSQGGLAQSGRVTEVSISPSDPPLANFDPEYLSVDSKLYGDLVNNNEMVSFGFDIARVPWNVFNDTPGKIIPYAIMVVLIGVLSWYQQQQIQGRSTQELNPQMKAMTKIIPWMSPFFAITLPAALGVYFIGSSLFRVAQNFIITKRFYEGADDTPLADDDLDDWEPEEGAEPPKGGFAQMFGEATKPAAKADPGARHGTRRPVTGAKSSRNRARPPRTESPAATEKSGKPGKSGKSSKSTKANTSDTSGKGPGKAAGNRSNGTGADADDSGGSLWARAKRSAAASAEDKASGTGKSGTSKARTTAEQKTSKRVTPKGSSNNKKKK